jgi:hypothetical protein
MPAAAATACMLQAMNSSAQLTFELACLHHGTRACLPACLAQGIMHARMPQVQLPGPCSHGARQLLSGCTVITAATHIRQAGALLPAVHRTTCQNTQHHHCLITPSRNYTALWHITSGCVSCQMARCKGQEGVAYILHGWRIRQAGAMGTGHGRPLLGWL